MSFKVKLSQVLVLKQVDVMREHVHKHRFKVYGDGDLDGIVGVGLLVRVVEELGFEVGCVRDVVSFPRPETLRGRRFSNCVLVEITLSKGVVYEGDVLLFDHHEGGPRLDCYANGELVDRVEARSVLSVASLIAQLYRDVLDLSRDELALLAAVDDADNLAYRSPLSVKLHEAYQLNMLEEDFRYELVEWIKRREVSRVFEWAERESCIYRQEVSKKIEELLENVRVVGDGKIAVFTVRRGHKVEMAARNPVMMKLEEKYPVVVCLTISNEGASGRIATARSDLDLTPIFRELRELGVTAGGRRNVGGVKFPSEWTVEECVKKLEKIILKYV